MKYKGIFEMATQGSKGKATPAKRQKVGGKGQRSWVYLEEATASRLTSPPPYSKGKGKGKSKGKRKDKGKVHLSPTYGKGKNKGKGKAKGKSKGKSKGKGNACAATTRSRNHSRPRWLDRIVKRIPHQVPFLSHCRTHQTKLPKVACFIEG